LAGGGSSGDSLPDVQHGRDMTTGREPGRGLEEDGDKKEDDEQEPGGLFGKRLHGRGPIRVEYIYTGEILSNARGGISTQNATQYFGQMDLAIHADLEKLGFAPGGKLFLLGENTHGRGLTQEFVGDFQWLSNIDAPRNFTQVSEYWWERSLLHERIAVRLGKQDCNAEFDIVDLGGDFINCSFGYDPTVPMPSYPNPSMAAALFVKLHEKLTFKAGVWDGAPDGLTWGVSGTGTTFSIYEFKLKWDLKPGMPGDAHAGLWYHSDRFDDITPAVEMVNLAAFRTRQSKLPPAGGDIVGIAAAGDVYEGNHGFYCGAEQMIWKEKKADKKDVQGFGAFVQYGWAPPDRNPATQYLGAGVVYKGLIPRRDEDTCGLGMAKVYFSDRLPDVGSETAIELFYKVRLGKYVSLQPDLQYIAQPSGIYRDAFVAGLRFQTAM
jgi:porin